MGGILPAYGGVALSAPGYATSGQALLEFLP